MIAPTPTYGAQVERQRLDGIRVTAPFERRSPGGQTGQVATDGNQGLMFSIDVHTLDLIPGGAAVVTAQLRNKGTIVDAMTVDVIGLPPDWVTFDTRTVNLYVDAEGVVRIRIAPPIHHSTQRGLIAVEVAAWSATNPNVRCVQRLDVHVAGFQDIDARITPGKCVARFVGKYSIVVANGGNSKLEATLQGAHDEGTVTVACRPSRLTVAPGARASATVVAQPPFLFTGAPVLYNLIVSVDTGGNSRDFPVTLKQPPVLSKWLARILLAALVIVIVVVGILIFHKHKGKIPSKPHTIGQNVRPGSVLLTDSLHFSLPAHL